jgi:transcriptional regulator with XRE-family HTH domain
MVVGEETMPAKDVAQLIDDLFQTRLKSNGEHYTNQEIANWITENIPGAEISPSYISKLRLGESRNPSRDVLLYFCIAFKVQPSYFFPELSHMEETDRVDNSTMLRMALHAYGLDEESQRYLEGLVRKLRLLPRDQQGRSRKPND